MPQNKSSGLPALPRPWTGSTSWSVCWHLPCCSSGTGWALPLCCSFPSSALSDIEESCVNHILYFIAFHPSPLFLVTSLFHLLLLGSGLVVLSSSKTPVLYWAAPGANCVLWPHTWASPRSCAKAAVLCVVWSHEKLGDGAHLLGFVWLWNWAGSWSCPQSIVTQLNLEGTSGEWLGAPVPKAALLSNQQHWKTDLKFWVCSQLPVHFCTISGNLVEVLSKLLQQ